jgi:hypothetical protein
MPDKSGLRLETLTMCVIYYLNKMPKWRIKTELIPDHKPGNNIEYIFLSQH